MPMYWRASYRNCKIASMFVELDFHLWYKEMCLRRISLLKGDKLRLQEENAKLKEVISVLQDSKANSGG